MRSGSHARWAGASAINGNTNSTFPPKIAAGDKVTYRIVYDLSTSNIDKMSLSSFLPLPVFDATQLTTFDNVTNGSVPAVGHFHFSPTDTYHNISGIVPTVSTSSTSNSLTLNYGTYHDPSQRASVVDVLYSVAASDSPFADGLFLTNQAHENEGSTNNGTASTNAIVLSTSLASVSGTNITIDEEVAYQVTITVPNGYLPNADPGVELKEFARVAKAEHRIEECFERAKSEAGLGDYQVMNWIAWHHHQTLALLAAWFLTRETGGEKIRTAALTSTQLRQLIAGTIEEYLGVNDPSTLVRRGTRWLVRIEQARFYHHHCRKVLPPLENQLRTSRYSRATRSTGRRSITSSPQARGRPGRSAARRVPRSSPRSPPTPVRSARDTILAK